MIKEKGFLATLVGLTLAAGALGFAIGQRSLPANKLFPVPGDGICTSWEVTYDKPIIVDKMKRPAYLRYYVGRTADFYLDPNDERVLFLDSSGNVRGAVRIENGKLVIRAK